MDNGPANQSVVSPTIHADRGRSWASCALLIAGRTFGDEGLWLFNRPPLRQLHARYDFEPTADWLEHLQKSCVRFNEGGSGSFVSADGLVMANQHVGADVLPRLGDKDHNYYRDGFYAKMRDQEIRCEGLELDVLMSIEDVTARVKAVLKSKMTPEETAAVLRGDGGNRGRIGKKNRPP